MKITVSLVLLVLAIVAFAIAAACGFGFVDDVDIAEDYPGWVAAGLALFAAAHLPWSK